MPTLTSPATVRPTSHAVLGALVLGAVAMQIAYPLTRSTLRDHLTVGIVVAFALACVVQATVTRGLPRAVVVLAVTAVPGYLVEVVGVHTGLPFGTYRYSEVFGPRLLDVPLVIGLAWTMMLWPAALVARRLVTGPVARVLLAAWATTAGDLFLDPQMVSTGAWTWRNAGLHLPGVPDVPLSNYAGWLAVTVVLSALLQATMGDGGDTVGLGLYLWSWIAWTMALAVFLDLRTAAAWGAAAMGSVAVPVLAVLVRQPQRTPRDQRPHIGEGPWVEISGRGRTERESWGG